MGCLGVHFAITPEQAQQFQAAAGSEQVLSLLGQLESRWERDWLSSSGKAWDAMHLCLAFGLSLP